MKHRSINLAILLLAIANISNISEKGQVLGASSEQYKKDSVTFTSNMETTTAFDQKEIEEYEDIPYEIEYVENSDMEYGTEEVISPGVDGLRTKTYLLTYWIDEIIDKTLINTEIQNPENEIVSKGTKIIWREYMTPDVGDVKYWYKLRVFATKYDGNCIGCSGRTYSGTTVVKGVCAVDPSVIKLGTNFYVDGYGLCRAEDIGGAIKGNKIDLGFEDASKGAWGAQYTDIYLLTNNPY